MLIVRALDIFCFRHGVLSLLLITPGQNRVKPNFPRFQENISQNISQEPLKLFYQKVVYDFTAGLSKNVKILLWWIYNICFATKVLKEVVFKSAIYTTSVSLTIKGRIWAFHKIGVISICKNYEIFVNRWLFALYIPPFLTCHTWQDSYLLCSCFPGANFLLNSSLYHIIS